MKSVLLFLVMICMTISLSAQWKNGYPGEERMLNSLWQKTFPVDTTLGFISKRHSKQVQNELYSNSIRQNAITHQLDSLIYMGFSENTSQWVGFFRSIFQYTAEEKLESETIQYFNEALHTWEYGDKLCYAYNKNQQLVLDSSLTWDADNGNWESNYKTNYAYDPSMQLISRTSYYWYGDLKDWYASYKTTYTYTQSNQLESEIYATWNATDLWIEMYRDEYEYDEDGLLIELVSSEKYNPHDAWRYTDRIIFEYDSLDQLSYENNYYYQDNGSWLLNSRKGNTYDANGNVVEELYESWNSINNLWRPSTLFQYTHKDGHETGYYMFTWNYLDLNWKGLYGGTAAYNEYGDISERVDLLWNEMLAEWEMREKIEYDYDFSVDFTNVLWPYPNADPSDLFQRMPTSIQFYDYDGDWVLENSALLRYSIRTAVLNLNIEPLVISPNPANEFIQFSIPGIQESSTLKVYTPDGKLLISANTFENTRISTSSLLPGWYIARIQNGKELFIGKFIKE